VGRYQEAEPFLLKALPLFESAKGPSDPETIQASERIALNYDNCPEIGKDPEPYFRRAVEAIAPDGEMRKTYIENLCRWADYVARRRRFEEADQLFAQLLSLITDPNKASDLTLFWMSDHCVKYFRSRGKAELVASLADVYRNYDAYGEMVKNQSEHAEQTLAEDDPAFAEAIFNSANLALFNEKYDEAQSLLDRALTAYTKIGGDQSERVAHVLCRICVVNRLMKKFDASEAAIQRALDITKRLYVDRYVYPSALENLALLREAEGKIAEATELYERAVSEYERTCGFASHDAAEGTYRQSGYLFRIQSFDLAETKIRRAISVMDGIDSLSDYDRSDYVATLSSILEAKGQMEEATGMRKRAEALYRRAKEKSETEEDDP
jgi:tetratricopeptide (TPR) repeat protein